MATRMGDATCEQEREKKQKLDPVVDVGDIDTAEDSGGGCRDMETDQPIPPVHHVGASYCRMSPPRSRLNYVQSLDFPISSTDDPDAASRLFTLLKEKGPYISDMDYKDAAEIYSLYCQAGPEASAKILGRLTSLDDKIRIVSLELYLNPSPPFLVSPSVRRFAQMLWDRRFRPDFWSAAVHGPVHGNSLLFAEFGLYNPLEDPYPYLCVIRCPFTGITIDYSLNKRYEACSLYKQTDQQFVDFYKELEKICFTKGEGGSGYLYSEADLPIQAQKIALALKITHLSPADVREAREDCLMVRERQELCDEARQLLKECLQMDGVLYDDTKVDKIKVAYITTAQRIKQVLKHAAMKPEPYLFLDIFHKMAWEELMEKLPTRAWFLERKLQLAKLLDL